MVNFLRLIESMIEEERKKIRSRKREGRNIEEIVTEILLYYHKEERSKNNIRQLLYEVVTSNVKENKPIPISMSLAYGGMALNPYKFRDWNINMPRLGDVWMLISMSLIDEEVKKFYKPGIEWYIFDEEEHLILIGHSKESIERRRRILIDMWNVTKRYFEINTNINFERIPNFISNDTVDIVDEEIIIAIGCSIEDFKNIPQEDAMIIMDGFYTSKEKKQECIKLFSSKYIKLWVKAENLAKKIIALNNARKENNCYKSIIGRDYIDASITIKENRYTPKLISGSIFPQHGETVIADNKVKIIPYYRLKGEYWHPIEINLIIEGKEIKYTFCFISK